MPKWKTNPLVLLLASIFFVLLVSEALRRLGLETQFYVWEFKIDLKLIILGVFCYIINRKFEIGFNFDKIGVRNWSWSTNLKAFLLPLGLLAFVITAGIFLKATAYRGVDNTATFLLATFFDIPAIFFFSITTLLLEEIIFRGFAFNAISKKDVFVLPTFLASSLWALISFTDNMQTHDSSFRSILLGLLNLISIGFVCSALLWFSKSIWSSFSFRIGLLVFSSALLCRIQDDTNSFFTAKMAFFSSNGFFLTFCNFAVAAFLLKLRKTPEKSSILQ